VASFLFLDLVLEDLGLDLEVSEFLPQALRFHAQLLPLLFANLDLFLQHDGALNSNVVLGLQVLERRRSVSRLPLIIIVGHLDVAEF
jgi:hypothetical protein